MLVSTAAIAKNAFLESIRQPIYLVLILLSGVCQLFTVWSSAFAMGYTESSEVSGDNKMLLDVGLATIFVCGMLLAAFVATAVLSREIDNKTVLMVVSKPISRPAVVVGKYLGVTLAIAIASLIMLIFLLMGVRHGVLSTSADTLDGPVLVFTFSAVALALILGAVLNYLYGWTFSQTAVLALLPALLVAYFLVLMLNKKWELQELSHDFKPQITTACAALTMAILVLTAIATAISTRLGQVMTIFVCAGVFLFGLLSNHLIGRYVFVNEPVAKVRSVAHLAPEDITFARAGDTFTLTLLTQPDRPLTPGIGIYYGENPNGFNLAVPDFGQPAVNLDRDSTLFSPDVPPAIILTRINGQELTIRNLGGNAPGRPGLPVARPPQADDWIFLEPTTVRWPVLALWAVIPNMHYFWLLDAVSQNVSVPASHLALIALYSLAQIIAFLALGVALFQKRDVG